MKAKTKKKALVDKVMKEFDKHGGGSAVEVEFTSPNPRELKRGLQNSFDEIFPDLVNKAKLRKHVIFDEDVFETYDGLAKGSKTPFSALINSALRRFAIEKFSDKKLVSDPVTELLALQKRERELIEQIKKQKLDIRKVKIG